MLPYLRHCPQINLLQLFLVYKPWDLNKIDPSGTNRDQTNMDFTAIYIPYYATNAAHNEYILPTTLPIHEMQNKLKFS